MMKEATMAQRKVLVTGATGYVASLVLPSLRERYDLTLMDVRTTRRDGTEVEGTQVADLLNDEPESLRRFFAGQDSVVHLAFNRAPDAAMSGAQRATRLTPGSPYEAERGNVDMAYRVLQFALDEEIRRVVIASSNHAADWYEHLIHAGRMNVVLPETFPKSDNFYGWAKATYEHLGFVYASGALGQKVENVHLRIGAPREINAADFADNPKGYKRDLGAYISARDLSQLVVKSIETENIEDAYGIPWQIFYGISNNTRAFWSNVNARRVIGYAPEDDSEVKYAADIQRLLHDNPGRT
jgi:hypothetical protein